MRRIQNGSGRNRIQNFGWIRFQSEPEPEPNPLDLIK